MQMNRSPLPANVLWRILGLLVALVVVFLLVQPSVQPETGVEQQPVEGGPVLLRDDMTLRKVADVGVGNIKLALNPLDGDLYFLNPGVGLFRVDVGQTDIVTQVAAIQDIIADAFPTGMTIGPDGAIYVVANRTVEDTSTQAVILRGTPVGAAWRWQTLASTEPYPKSNTPFDHMFNGLTASPDGQWVFVNSGSRTDHGEVEDNGGAFPGTREVPLTSKIYRLPANAVDLVLPNDLEALTEMGVIFSMGTRNAFDPEFAPNGELFVGDNGPDADFPDELNWIREGRHYGFPWRFGVQDNPQQFPGYDPAEDNRLSPDFTAVQIGAYHNDPDYPAPPAVFTDPVANLGPSAAQYRDADGRQQDAAALGEPLYSFTPHRSPLGLVFATDPRLPDDLEGNDRTLSAFLLSWGSAGGTLTDRGQDLLHLRLSRAGDNYVAEVTQIARDFKNPIDAVMIENRLYILEFGAEGAIWEITFQ